MIGQPINDESYCGLRVDVVLKLIKEDKPLIYVYTYMMNTLRFKEYLEECEARGQCEGALAHEAKGIQLVNVGGAKKWDKTAFSIDNEEGEKMFLPLLTQEVTFHIHRDLFAGKEWEIFIADSNFHT